MDDRQLIELAAKATGDHLDLATWDEESGCLHYPWKSPLTNMYLWNPLTDDGDALRLQAHLRMRVEYGTHYAVCYAGTVAAEQFTERIEGDDVAAATRRAIVRAAASLPPRLKGA